MEPQSPDRRWPWHDAPACPKCGAAVGTPIDSADRGVPTGEGGDHLACVACGHDWNGTPAEAKQARKAFDSWDRIARGEVSEEWAKQEVLDEERRERLRAEAEAAQVGMPWAVL